MNLRSLISLALLFGLGCTFNVRADDRAKLTQNQRLIVAAFDLDVEQLKLLLKEGADPNSRFGARDRDLFTDKWTLGSHMASARWTALQAVANSHREPQPEIPVKNTIEELEAARKQRDAIDPKSIAERDDRRKAITKLLIDAKADLDLDDGVGATALGCATSKGYEAVALLLIESGAKIDTKTGVYIDGPSGTTPLHHAAWKPTILKAMLKKGAKVNVKTSNGDTPLHYAAMAHQVESVKSLLEAGADPQSKNKDGDTPEDWCRTYGRPEPGDAEKKQIAKLLQAAKAKK